MTVLPAAYAWLAKEPGPRLLTEALSLYGVVETPGRASNRTILDWAEEVGGAVDDVYKADDIPWCGLFAAVVAKRAGWEVQMPRAPLWALSWAGFGQEARPRPMLGDVLVFVRRTAAGARAGHVGFYVGEDREAFHVLGGNQSDAVNIQRIARARLYAARRPAWRVAQPDNVRPVQLSARGRLSSNEA